MYRLLRNTHLLLGLFFCFFVLMFGLSSVQMSHRWMKNEPVETNLTVSVDPQQAGTPRALAQLLMDKYGMRGGLNNVEESPEEMKFVIGRMGTVHEVRYKLGEAAAEVTKKLWPFIGIMVSMHHTFGLHKAYGLHVFWAVPHISGTPHPRRYRDLLVVQDSSRARDWLSSPIRRSALA